MSDRIELVLKKLKDSRSKKVIFVSHCILNQNTRYLGGAFRPAVVNEILNEILSKNIGIIQLPCPEQAAWGGILKPLLWKGIGIKSKPIYFFRKIIFPFFIWYTKRVYRKIARVVVKQIQDYQKATFEIIGFIGVGSSPTCGIENTLDLKKYELLADINIQNLSTNKFNELLFKKLIMKGKGLFIQILHKELKHSNLEINFYEHDLKTEMNNSIKKILN